MFNVLTVTGEVRALLLALVQVDQIKKASELQDAYSTAITSTIALLPQVWSEEVVNSAAQVCYHLYAFHVHSEHLWLIQSENVTKLCWKFLALLFENYKQCKVGERLNLQLQFMGWLWQSLSNKTHSQNDKHFYHYLVPLKSEIGLSRDMAS